MKSFKDHQIQVDEASQVKKPQDNTAAKVNAAVSTLQLRKQGVNPAAVTTAQKRLNSFAGKNMTPSQSYNRLGTNVRNQYFQFGNEVPTGLLDPSISTGAFRQIVQRLKSTKQQIAKAQIDAEKMAARAQEKASKQPQQMKEDIAGLIRDVRSGKPNLGRRTIGHLADTILSQGAADIVKAAVMPLDKNKPENKSAKLTPQQIADKKKQLLAQRRKGTSMATSTGQGFKDSKVGKARVKLGPDGKYHVVREGYVFESSEEFNPPALITLKRIGIRNFPDGRRVAMYLNKQLDLVFSVPFVGKGQTPGEIIPGVSVQGIKEDLDKAIPDEGTPVKVIGNVEHAGRKGKIVSSNKDGSFHVVDIGGKKYSFHGSDLTLAEEVDELNESAASFIAHMKAAMKAKDEEIKERHLLKAKDARLSMTNAEITKYKELLDQHREMMSEEVEELDEANVRIVGKKKLIRARVRGGKIQRRKVVSAVPGFKVVGGQVKRESAKERLDRKRGARKAKIKRRAKLARSLIKRKRSLRKRESMGLNR